MDMQIGRSWKGDFVEIEQGGGDDRGSHNGDPSNDLRVSRPTVIRVERYFSFLTVQYVLIPGEGVFDILTLTSERLPLV